MKKIVLTGGGTAGHVTPNIALLPALSEAGYEVSYIGSKNGMEKELIENTGTAYYGISSGKLRRYFDWKNFSDPFRVVAGYFEARSLLKKIRPNVVFSKGGFVSVPVMLAAKSLHIPAILHESDMTPGLANKIALRSASKVCCNFPETAATFPEGRAIVTGTPIRQELLQGNKENAYKLTGFGPDKPIILIMGGSQGSAFINNAVRSALDTLLKDFYIIHLCGQGKRDDSLNDREGYIQYEYVTTELPDFFAASDIIISRAGANAICELLALRIPNILIPLSLNASRGDQILNAGSFEKQGFSYVMEEESVTADSLIAAISHVKKHADEYRHAMESSAGTDSISSILSIIEETALS